MIQKKIAASLLLCLTLFGTSSCMRNEMPVKQSTSKTKLDHLIIKEVFYIGHYWFRDTRKWGMKKFNQLYNEDQYITIYNPTDEVKYLDGLALCINAIDPTKAIQFAPKDDFVNKYYGASAISYFPGKGNDYPVKPGQTIVVAKYAIDHKKQFEEELEGKGNLKDYVGFDDFLDLSKADFEWTNINYDPGKKNNPDVPDLNAILTEKDSKGNIGAYDNFSDITESCGIALIKMPWTPEEFAKNYVDTKDHKGYKHYITVTNTSFADFYAIEVPLQNVIDCMTICPRRLFQIRPSKLDRGYNAVMDNSKSGTNQNDYPKYSGLALTRKWDGKKFVDDNNSTADFEVKKASLSRKNDKEKPKNQ